MRSFLIPVTSPRSLRGSALRCFFPLILIAAVWLNILAHTSIARAQGTEGVLQPVELTRLLSLEGRVPLILVHGWCGAESTWDDFIASFTLIHRFKLYSFNYPTGNGPIVDPFCVDDPRDHTVSRIKSLAEQLTTQIDDLIGTDREVVFVTHSMGGLIVRSFMQELAGHRRTLGLITLATPHHGVRTVETFDANRELTGLYWDRYDNAHIIQGLQNNWLRCLNGLPVSGDPPCAVEVGSTYTGSRSQTLDKLVTIGGIRAADEDDDGVVAIDSALILMTSIKARYAGLNCAGFSLVPAEEHQAIHDNGCRVRTWTSTYSTGIVPPINPPLQSGGTEVFEIINQELLDVTKLTRVNIPVTQMVSGQSFTASWDIERGTTFGHTHVHYDTIDDLSPLSCLLRPSCETTPVQSAANGTFNAQVTAPVVSAPTIYYFAVHADIDGIDFLSRVVPVLIVPSTGPLANGVPKTDSVTRGTWKFYSIAVPAGATSLKIITTNASGDVDLYVKFNQTPSDTVYDCRPFSASGNETCEFPNPAPGTWFIGVKGFAAGTHTYTVTATVTVPTTVFQDNIENGSGGWFAEFSWGITTATSHSGTHSWTDSLDGNYANNANTSLWSPFLNFSSVNSATLTFWHRYDLESGLDFGRVWVTTNNGLTFTQVASFTGTNTTWTQATINLEAFAGHPSVRVVFQLFSDSSVTQDGWYIDDIAVSGTLIGNNTGPVDVFFIADLSSSFSDELPTFKSQAADIITNLRASNSNIRFGLGKLEDYPISPFGSAFAGDKAYQRVVDLTFNTDTVLNAIATLFVRDGGDFPQSQLAALYQAATGAGENLSGVGFSGASIPAGQQASFRNGASKLLMLWTDAPFHQRGDPGGPIPYPGPTFAQTVDAINALGGAKFMGILSGSDGLIDLQNMAAATGSVAPAGGVDCNADGIIDIPGGAPLACPISLMGAGIGDAILALVAAATVPSIFINDVAVTEGNTGTVNAVFTVSLSATSAQTVTVNYSTANNTAAGGASCTGGTDYISASGMLTFTPGQTSQPINVAVCGDTVVEPNKTFFVNLTLATNATIAHGQGVGTIINDDSVNDTAVDFEGDGRSDVAVYQTSTGHWFVVRSTMGPDQHLNFGGPNFLPVLGDYDGDGITDTAVYDTTTGNWFIDQTTADFRVHPSFGGAGFIPVPGDYDGDGKTDVAVYQVSTGHWFMVRSTLGVGQHLAFGGPGFVPVPADYDGDGQTDTAVYDTTTGNWFIAQSTAGFRVHPSFGGSGFIPVPGDYDGDGKADVGVYQSSTGNWFAVGSTQGFLQHLAFGGGGFMPVPGDYDGDGETDTAVYEQSTGNWFIDQSTAGFRTQPSFGGPGFVPVLPQVTILRALGLL